MLCRGTVSLCKALLNVQQMGVQTAEPGSGVLGEMHPLLKPWNPLPWILHPQQTCGCEQRSAPLLPGLFLDGWYSPRLWDPTERSTPLRCTRCGSVCRRAHCSAHQALPEVSSHPFYLCMMLINTGHPVKDRAGH